MKILSELALGEEPLHTVGGKDLCALFDISPAALTDLKKRGLAVHLSHDCYDLTATTRAYVQHLRSMAAGWGTGDQAVTLTNERARLAKEQADAQAIKNAKLRGELVEASDVERTWGDALRQLRARILAVPSRMRSDLPDIDPQTIDAIDRALRSILTEVGNGN
ncbi:DNA packaging protein [Sulfitobacter guttiformis]|uniref:Phage terminase Nu1 subunit (DNA packaging protein) n=1 Tax=Sulfitobacter guttiformis TaxID=74349 RepID=A0A420DNT5_9RHOB|nr:DNA packaging protein [Sulfitobacter guttiformis]KIN73272.1 Phage DNA packaging protein Nu1 subunit of terminase-like protein [Sulfitobacter guttiformis KCTC 32187]RKE95944.1 phage terminase Nu1 subunit (DNA packaging protein) [Sulfitobacter guttiformis]